MKSSARMRAASSGDNVRLLAEWSGWLSGLDCLPRGRSGRAFDESPARMEGMDGNKLYEMALVLGNGWRMVKSEMDVAGRRL